MIKKLKIKWYLKKAKKSNNKLACIYWNKKIDQLNKG